MAYVAIFKLLGRVSFPADTLGYEVFVFTDTSYPAAEKSYEVKEI